ncbi:MAG: glycosyltransferase family 4 protein [Clostridia bacterium]
MRIGIFTDTYHPDINGVVTSIKMLEREMKKRGHEVYVFSPSKHAPTENENLYMLKSIPLFVAKKFKYRVATFYSRTIAKEIKELNLDIVHTQSEFSLPLFGKIISRKFNIPFIHTYHTMWEDYMHYIIPVKGGRNIYPKRFARTVSKAFVRKAECIITPSKKTEKYLKYKCGVKNKPIYIIPTGIDIEPFNPSNFSIDIKNNLKQKLGIKKDEKVVLFLGRIAEEKSVDQIISAIPEVFKKLTNTKLVLVGEGPAKEDLILLSKKLNIQDKVIFTGAVPWEQVSLYYSIGDVFVNTSTTETQGLTFIESMAAGVPVVAKYAPNLAEFIHNNENGLLIRNEKELSDSIIKVLTDNKLKETLVTNGFITASENSSKEFGDKLVEVYTQIIENHKIRNINKNKEKVKEAEKTSSFNLKKKLLKITKLARKKG